MPAVKRPLAPLFSSLLALALALATATISASGAPKTVRLLTVGNSFSHNATHYLDEIAQANGDTLILREDNVGGASFEVHLKKICAAEQNPQDKLGTYAPGRSLKDDLTQQKWDFITIQQASIKSHDLATYQPHARELAAFIRKHAPDATLLLHQTWEYRVDDPRFSVKQPKPGEPRTQDEMYAGLKSAYAATAQELGLKLIPVGDAFHAAGRDPVWGYRPPAPAFDAKSARPGQLPEQAHSLHVGWHWKKHTDGARKLIMDGHHANLAGEYLGACVWYETLFGKCVEGTSYVPEGLEPAFARFLQTTAHRVAHPAG